MFTDRYASVDPRDTIGHPNVFLMTGATWKLLRSKLSPFFTSGKMKKMIDLMVVVAEDLDRYIDNLNLGGKFHLLFIVQSDFDLFGNLKHS